MKTEYHQFFLDMATRLLQEMGDVKIHFKIHCKFRKVRITIDEATGQQIAKVKPKYWWLSILVISVNTVHQIVNPGVFNQLQAIIDNFEQNGSNYTLESIICAE